jgi:hypothetical protein
LVGELQGQHSRQGVVGQVYLVVVFYYPQHQAGFLATLFQATHLFLNVYGA